MLFNGFSKEGTAFLKKLEKNNSKVWFENNRHIWEKEILAPNKAFIKDMGETLQILVPTIKVIPKVSGSLFKIYRDVRFSKDKTAMKDKIGLLFWQGLGHRMQSSSFYMHYTKEKYFVASGIRSFKPPLLKTYRNYIKNEKHRDSLHLILEELKKKGYKYTQEKYKRVPKDFTGNETHLYLTKFDSLFSYIEYDLDDTFYSVELLDKLFQIYDDMKELQKWVYKMTLTHKEE
ncbi:MAG: TIGR02453 family protein [Arcobacter sp.]|nr:MAG: TIGR02453 family protein [Arcobacter sp.]